MQRRVSFSDYEKLGEILITADEDSSESSHSPRVNVT